jgi:hypothetical protein
MLDHLGIEMRRPRGLAGRRIAHMDMGDRRSRPGGFDRGIGDLARRHRHAGMLADGIARAGHGTGHEDFEIHAALPDRPASKGGPMSHPIIWRRSYGRAEASACRFTT